MTISRNQEHFIIMTVIYNGLLDATLGEGQPPRGVSDIVLGLTGKPFENNTAYFQNIIVYVFQKYGEIVTILSKHLKNWKWERIPLLTQSVLLMSYAHAQLETIDKAILINIAVDLAKKYIDSKQAKFINAILDGVIQ